MSSASVGVEVLGPVRLRRSDDENVEIASARGRALLVSLALAPGRRPVPVGALTEDLWGDDIAPADPRGALQTVVSRLRHIGGPALIESTPAGYRLGVPSDLETANIAARAAQDVVNQRPSDALKLAREGLELWRGSPGDGVSEAPGAALRVHSERTRTDLRRVLLSAALGARRWDEVRAAAEQRLVRDPVDEEAAVAMLRACVATSAVTDGLRAYAALSEALAEELGTSPSRVAREQHEALLRIDAEATSAAPSSAATGQKTAEDDGGARGIGLGLRQATTPLIGRDGDIDDLMTGLTENRLVTILGPGGMGKTRLAHEMGWRALAAGTALVVVVELANVTSDEDVLGALGVALGVQDVTTGRRLGDRSVSPGLPARIRERLVEPGTLVVMDNCEHVLDGAARTVAWLLETTDARVLATSRAPLEVDGEWARNLAPLGTGSPGGPAVELFRQRARAVRSDVALEPAAVATLCSGLDGLPLAIELAAARVRSMTVEEITAGLGRRFALLTGGARSAPPRHRTLHAVIAWSWEMLTVTEREVMRRACILPAGFDVGFVEREHDDAGAADVVARDVVASLVSQSLLVMVEDAQTRTSRYRMLETVREFAALELEATQGTAAARQAAVVWARELAEALVPRIVTPHQREAVLHLASEQDNLVQAMRWAHDEGDATSALAIFGAIAVQCSIRGTFFELVGLVEEVRLIARWANPAGARDAVLTGLVFITLGLTMMRRRLPVLVGRLVALSRHPELVGETWAEAISIMMHGLVETHASTVAAEARASNVAPLVLVGYLAGCAMAENEGRLDAATALGERGVAMAREARNLWAGMAAAQLLAQVSNERGDHAAATRWFQEAQVTMRDLGAPDELSQLELSKAGNLLAAGRLDEAAATYRAAIDEDESQPEAPARSMAEETWSGRAERRAAGFAGLGEIAWLQGDAALAMDRYDRCLSEIRSRGSAGGRPWYVVHAAARLCVADLDAAHVALAERDPDGVPGASPRLTAAEESEDAGVAAVSSPLDAGPARSREQRLALARRLRVVTSASLRLDPQRADAPVLGAALVALGSWLWSDPHSDRADEGLEMIGLGESLGSRQDVPSLHRATHVAVAEALWGETRVRKALRLARGLPDRTAVLARARELFLERLR